MSLSSQGARATAHSLRRPVAPRIPRRYASQGAEHGHGHGTGESAMHVDAGVKAGGEGFGKSFYISLALVPFTYLIYTTATAKRNPIERFVDQYLLKTEVENEKNALHSRMMEQAMADRALFKDSGIDFGDLRCDTQSMINAQQNDAGPLLTDSRGLNHGSPMNVVAGQGSADMSELMRHLIEERQKSEASNGSGRRRILEER